MPVTKAQVKQIALGFPGALEKPSYGKPAFVIEKKFFTRVRDEDASIVMIVGGMEQRDMMLELDPETYFITDHYKNYPSILVRMARITPSELKTMLQRRWEQIAPKKLVKGMAPKAKAVIPGERRKARWKGTQVSKPRKRAKKKARN